MADRLTEEQISSFKEGFSLFDRHNTGSISNTDILTVMRALGLAPTREDVNAMILEIHPDGHGAIDFPEFLSMCAHIMSVPIQEEQIMDAFRIFDKKGSGWISATQVRNLFSSIGEMMTDEEIDEMMREADIDHNGKINYEDFQKMMMAR